MADLKTKYAGLDLKNPLIIGASKFGAQIDRIKKAEESGIAALVAPSLFEEQINLESLARKNEMAQYHNVDPEIASVFPEGAEDASPKEHYYWLRKAKEEVEMPIIGSLNCINPEKWLEFATEMEQTGIDALELNFYHTPGDFERDATDVEKEQIEITKQIVEKLNIPVTVKLSYFYTNTLNFIKELDNTGVAGVVLFNRLFQPDVDVQNIEHISPFKLSTGTEKGIALRFAGLLHNEINASIASNTGFYFGEDIVRAILMGADAAQLVSTFVVNGLPFAKIILQDMENWMELNKFNSIDEFKGKLSKANTADKMVYKRAQYIDMLFNKSDIFFNG